MAVKYQRDGLVELENGMGIETVRGEHCATLRLTLDDTELWDCMIGVEEGTGFGGGAA